MGDQNNIQTEVKKKSLFSGMGGVSGWFSALTGKAKPAAGSEVPKETPKDKSEAGNNKISAEEDSVVQDIKSFKKFINKTFTSLKNSYKKPVVGQTDKGAVSNQAPKKFVDKGSLKKILSILVVLLILIALLYAGSFIFKKTKESTLEKEEGNQEGQEVVYVSPSPIEYIPYKPSVYSQDPEVINLEEEIKVLEKELTTTNIREDKLNPPSLDFNIKF